MRLGRTIVKSYGAPSGQLAGVLYDDGIYETNRSVKIHFFRKYQSYGVSKWILEELRDNGCIYIDILESRSVGQRKLRSRLELWFSEGLTYTDTSRGDPDLQIHLPVRAMSNQDTRMIWRAGRGTS